jgi:diguanylate cyclase (GGDEF)-like protein
VLFYSVAGIVVLLVLVAIAAWYSAEALVFRRIRALLKAANRVRAGDFSVRIGPSSGKSELSQLDAAFDAMAETLQQRDNELRAAVLELHSQATTDPLTRLSNRRQLGEMLPLELIRARRRDGQLSNGRVAVLMIDLDHFKKINDTHGHKAGDLVLAEVGQLLRAGVRASDIACRYGGEELSLVLPDTTLKVAVDRAEGIRARIANLELAHDGRTIGPITVSIGVAIFPDHAADADTLLKIADEALYEAKRTGRDRVCVASRKP